MPTVIEINCTTGESIEREMTTEEIAVMEAQAAEYAAQEAAKEAEAIAKAEAKAAVLARLGLTEDEAKLLLA